MDQIVRIAVIVIMTVVGLDLTPTDFRRLGERPALVSGATAAQWLFLPLVAWAVAWVLPLPAHIIAGMVLLAGCPAGAISNYYSYLARADVAFSVTLTAIGSVASVMTLPLIAGLGFRLLLAGEVQVAAPFGPIASQLVIGLLLPIAVGMTLRHRFGDFVTRHMRSIRRGSEVVLVVTIATLLIGLRETVLADLWATVAAAVIFTFVAAGVGAAVGVVLPANRPQAQTLLIEFACRNTAITILVGVAVLGRPELAVFGLIVFLTQMPLVLGGIAVANRRRT